MKNIYYASCGAGTIHACRWEPDGKPKGIVQIIHGIAEHAKRYDRFARFLCQHGYLVVAEDHMGHGESADKGSTLGYFHGGWFCAVKDSMRLLNATKREYPGVPYVLFGHSMGSFMARTILQEYPDSGIAGCIICGTGWMPRSILRAGPLISTKVAKSGGESEPSPKLQKIVFGGYNKKVEHVRTEFDWLTRDNEIVDEYIADPKCGFVATAGLLRDMLSGMIHIQEKGNLKKMQKDMPVLFIAGGDDPVGNYGKGVQKTAQMFEKVGMLQVNSRIYPLCRHEILNELNYLEIYDDVIEWLQKTFE